MKVVILAGGFGTRITEESALRPKPMIEIGGRPILWHIMKTYAHHGLRDFVVCLGYRGYLIKEYFANFVLHHSDVTIDTAKNSIAFHQSAVEPWRVTLIDTGTDTQTGGRLKRVRSHLNAGETFCLTYGDGVGDVDIAASIAFHRSHGKRATITAVVPPGRYGAMDVDGTNVRRFVEKPAGDEGVINGGYFVLEPSVIDMIDGDATVWEQGPLQQLAQDGELRAHRHPGFWHAMDTLRDKNHLDGLWQSGRAPWRLWE